MADAVSQAQAEQLVAARECKTPGCYYRVGLTNSHTACFEVKFPFSVETYLSGNIGVKPGPKLQRYEQRAAERERFAKLIHDALEPIMAEVFETMKPGGKIVEIIARNQAATAKDVDHG